MNALLILFALAGLINAQITVRWTGSASGDWNTATNWDSGVVPNNSTVDVIISTSSITVTLSTAVTVGSISLSSSTLNVTANLTVGMITVADYSSTTLAVSGAINALNASAKVLTTYGKVQLEGGSINVPVVSTSSTNFYVGPKNGTIADLYWDNNVDCDAIDGTTGGYIMVTNNFTWGSSSDINAGCNIYVTKYALFDGDSDKYIYGNGSFSVGPDAWLEWKSGRIYMYAGGLVNNWGKIVTVNTTSTSNGNIYAYSSSSFATVNNWGTFNYTQILSAGRLSYILFNNWGGLTGHMEYYYSNTTFYTGSHSANLTVQFYDGFIILEANFTANGTSAFDSGLGLVGGPSNPNPVFTAVGMHDQGSFTSYGVSIYFPPGTNATLISGTPNYLGGATVVNNGTYYVTSGGYIYWDSNSTFINWGDFVYSGSNLYWQGKDSASSGKFINVGTMHIRNYFSFRVGFSFLNCGEGEVNFLAKDSSNSGYINFDTPGDVNLEGYLNIEYPSQSVADGFTSYYNVFTGLPTTDSAALSLPKVHGNLLFTDIGVKPKTILRTQNICFKIGSSSSGIATVSPGLVPSSPLDCSVLNPFSLCPKWAGESKRQSSAMVVFTSAAAVLVALVALLL